MQKLWRIATRVIIMLTAVSLVGAAGAAHAANGAKKVPGCSAVTPTELQAIFAVPFVAGVPAGVKYKPAGCLFATAPGQPPAAALTGQVIVAVTPGEKAGAKAYGKALKAIADRNKTQVLNVGTEALVTAETGGVTGCPDSAGYRIDAKSSQGSVTVVAMLNGPTQGNACGRIGLSPGQMGGVGETRALEKL